MAIVKVTEPKMITFEFHQEKGDEDYGSCMWARFNLDLVNYTMFIESDCGNYGYGWVPTPEQESFLKLCAGFDEDYLLCKISSQTIVDAESTWESLKELIEYYSQGIPDDEHNWDMEEVKNACFSGYNERDVHNEIEYSLKCTKLEKEIEDFDIWECIHKDYPCSAKKIASVYCTHIIPVIKNKLKGGDKQ